MKLGGPYQIESNKEEEEEEGEEGEEEGEEEEEGGGGEEEKIKRRRKERNLVPGEGRVDVLEELSDLSREEFRLAVAGSLGVRERSA